MVILKETESAQIPITIRKNFNKKQAAEDYEELKVNARFG